MAVASVRHRAELVDRERIPVQARPDLPEQDRRTELDPHEHRDDRLDRCQQYQCGDREREIEATLDPVAHTRSQGPRRRSRYTVASASSMPLALARKNTMPSLFS